MVTRLLAAVLALACGGCSAAPSSSSSHATRPVALHIVATFSTLASLVSAVGGQRVAVTTLVPVGASPEDYQPTPRDVATLESADAVVENGVIEAWLDHLLATAKGARARRLVLSEGLPLRDGNPHLWMDPVFARAYVRKIAELLEALDPSGATAYQANAAAYELRLRHLQTDIARQIATIPPAQRTMVVFHNAWQYYNDRFGLRTVGVIELSPGQEPSPRYIADLIALARKNRVRAVFAEPEYNPKLARTLAQSAGIATVSDLYDDSIGTSPQVRDYPSMLEYDTQTIVRALR